jgi:hypothetical protein
MKIDRLKKMTLNELKELAAWYGIKTPHQISKRDLILILSSKERKSRDYPLDLPNLALEKKKSPHSLKKEEKITLSVIRPQRLCVSWEIGDSQTAQSEENLTLRVFFSGLDKESNLITKIRDYEIREPKGKVFLEANAPSFYTAAIGVKKKDKKFYPLVHSEMVVFG